jgi:hypothetical protein
VKFLLAVFVYLALGVLLGWGILMMMAGSYWLLASTVVVYLFLFAVYGCLPKKSH